MRMPHYSATLCMLHQMCWVSSLNPTYILDSRLRENSTWKDFSYAVVLLL